MKEFTYLENQLLIATPSIGDPYFHKSLIFLCEHNDEGAMGIMVNQPMNITLSDLLKHMELIKAEEPLESHAIPPSFEQHVLAGGPLQRERGFVLHSPAGTWQSSFTVNESLAVTTSRDILQAVVDGTGPQDVLVALGYTGWDAGQLEEEIIQNHWLNCSVNNDILFRMPAEQRWEAAGHLLGIDLNRFSSFFGHA